ncbi:MAG: type II secretion system protein GspE [Planctomycetota bacterium]|nr:MAG: type II secretion system protein GspE [Planctomycetota bacterium]
MKKERRPIGQLLKEMGLVTEFEIQEALQIQREQGGTLGEILVEMGVVEEKDILFALAIQSGMEMVDLDNMEIPNEVIERVDKAIVETYRVMPVDADDNKIVVAISDPTNLGVLDDLRFMLDSEVEAVVATEDSIERAIKRYYGGREEESIEGVLAQVDEEAGVELVESRTDLDFEQLERDIHSKPVVRLLNLILLQAIKDRASDIHLEPFEDRFRVRYRVDGVLYEMTPPPLHLAPALISRVKVMANLDIAETRVPQDGRIELNIAGRPIDLRVSTLPTAFGESVVMRVLDRSNVNLELDQLGLRPDEIEIVKQLVDRPHGIILVTGPTGSGKTTTLYSALNYANSPEIKILTAEDPVEYDLEGIVQVPVNEEIGVTFASLLRSFLRQDPDKILVGEIRDLETAEIAIQASLTGHVVFSTLHTNDAPSAIIRMLDLGVEPFLLAATLEAVIAQRLVRKICPNCRVEYEPSEEELLELELRPEEVEGKKFYYGRGCEQCNGIGYKGRTAIFEIMLMTEDLRQLVLENPSLDTLRQAAREAGMKTLRDSGLLAIYDGITTIEEVVRETILTA